MGTIDDLKAKGNAALETGDAQGAVKFYTEALTEIAKLPEPDDNATVAKGTILSNRCAAYCKLNDYFQGLKDAESCISARPNWAKGYSRKGACLAGLHRYPAAIEAYRAGLKLEPENATLQTGIQECEAAMKEQDKALPNPFAQPGAKEKLMADPKTRDFFKDPLFTTIIAEMTKNPNSLGKFLNDQRVLKCLSVLIGIDIGGAEMDTTNGSSETHTAGSSNNGNGGPQSSKKSGASASSKMETDEQPSQAKAEKDLGNEAYKRRDFDKAIEHYDKAIELEPRDITYLLNKSAVFFEQKRYDECKALCEKAVEVGRENRADYKLLSRAFGRIGNIYYQQKDLKSALTWYHKSLSEFRDPDVVKRALEIEKALKEEEKQAYLSPEIAETERQKGNEYFQKGNYPDALKHYSEAIKRNPTDHKLYSNRSACYTKLMEFQLALRDADECIKLDPTFVKGYLRKGACLMIVKDFSKAAQAYQKAMQLDPQCEEALECYRKCMMAEDDPEVVKNRAMADPEVKDILQDPAMQLILQQMQTDPASIRVHLQNPEIAKKVRKLIDVGVLAFR